MNTQVRAFIVISTVTLFGLATPAMAVVNWYNSSAADNSGGATVTVDNPIDQSGSWVDTFIGPTVTGDRSGRTLVQANGAASHPSIAPTQGAGYMLFSFGNLGIANADDVTSASLVVNANTIGASQTYTIYGTGAVSDSSTWANTSLDTTTASNQYGTFSSGTDGALSINLIDAIQAYIRGDISGIAIGTTEAGGFTTNAQNALLFDSSESDANLRPSLMVDFVPEPSTYALIFGLVALVGVVRRRNNRSSSMPIPA